MPAPIIQFAPFAHPLRWLLRRGEPSWLENESRWWVRAFRVSLVLGLLGTASGWLAAGCGSAFRVMDEVIDQKIDPQLRSKTAPFVHKRHRTLPFERELSQPELFGKTLFIDALQQSGPQCSMDLDCRSNDSLRHLSPDHLRSSVSPCEHSLQSYTPSRNHWRRVLS